ncbi:MAG: ATP-binding protein [Pseudomonadota bacterium]
MGYPLIQRLATGIVPMLLLFLLLLTSLYVLGNTAQDAETFGRFYIWLLVLNVLGVVFISVLIGINTWQLIQQFRAREAGSRLTVKMVIMLIVIALVPVGVVFSFSINFLRSGIDSWFNVEIGNALDEAIELSRDSLGLQMRTLQQSTRSVAEQLADASADEAVLVFSNVGDEDANVEWMLLSPDGDVIASRVGEIGDVFSNLPGDDLIQTVRETGQYVAIDSLDDRGYFARVLVPVLGSDPTVENPVLQGLFPLSEDIGALAENIEATYQDYRQLVFLREPLKVSYVLTLSLVLMLSVLVAVWFAFYSARRLMLPVHQLVEGTRAVAEGDYSTRLPSPGQDELGFLVRSFNDMTMRVARARDAAESSQAHAESQHAYLEAVLARISTGVLTVDSERVVQTANQAAANILETSLDTLRDSLFGGGVADDEFLFQFGASVQSHLDKGRDEWSAEFELFGASGRKVVVCRGAHIGEHEGIDSGYVLVFDDITNMVSAQREAAWSEVAQRLAHEIKNPLTPIQLSAERLRHKLLDRMAVDMKPRDAEMLDRATHTIVQQVQAMKTMVRAFADYANTPKADFRRLDVNDLIQEIAELYYGLDASLGLDLDLDEQLPPVMADRSRLRQLLHNLIKNAIEAQLDNDISPASVLIRSVVHNGRRGQTVELTVQDAGPGLPAEILDRLFEPHVTSKAGGTGLGMAIVKKIVEEHGGSVTASNSSGGGARVRVRLPVATLHIAESVNDASEDNPNQEIKTKGDVA